MPSLSHISDYSPFLESDRTFDYSGVASGASQTGVVRPDIVSNHIAMRLALFNTHLPATYMPATSPNNSGAIKYIYLVRNAFDVCHSFYNHLSHQSVSDGGFVGSESDFIELWSLGKIAFGPWGSHLRMWGDPSRPIPLSPLVLRYEDLKADLLSGVVQIYDHLWGAGHPAGLSREEVEALLPALEVGEMRENNKLFAPKSVEWSDRHNNTQQQDGYTFINKGEIGAGRKTLDEETRPMFKTGFELFPPPEAFNDLMNEKL